ncbi:MAG: mechanosensitive ion channel [Cyanothece sp. SIO2G6]|nr:mechanosensitive ion channel [Cyanothece sp. SIO2G6]
MAIKKLLQNVAIALITIYCVIATATIAPAQSPDGPLPAQELPAQELPTQEFPTQKFPAQELSGQEGAPVLVGQDIVFLIQENFGDLGPEQRAQGVNQRLDAIAIDPTIPVESIQVGDQDNITVIFSGNSVITYITQADAAVNGSEPQELAQRYVAVLRQAITTYRQGESLTSRLPSTEAGQGIRAFFRQIGALSSPDKQFDLGRSLLYTVIVSVIFLLLFFSINRIGPRLYQDLHVARQFQRLPGLWVRGVEVMTADQVAQFLISIFQFLQFGLTLVLVGLYLLIIFGLFPWTQQLEEAGIEYLIAGLETAWQSFVAYLPNLFIILTVIGVSYYVIYIVHSLFKRLGEGSIVIPGFYPEWAQPSYRILEVIIVAMTAVIVMPYLPGFGSPAFQGVSLFLGVLVSLGSTTAVANAVSGIILIYTRAFQIGDRIKIGDTLGNVEEKSLLVTRLRTWDNLIVTLPNANLLLNNIINYSASLRERNIPTILYVNITLGYDVPWQEVYTTLIRATQNAPGVLREPPPFVQQVGLGDFSVSYDLCVYTDQANRMEAIYSALRQNMQDCCNEADIEILSPTYSAIRDGNQSTIPASYLPDDYKTPGFQLNPLGNLLKLDLSMGPTDNGKRQKAEPVSREGDRQP